MRKGKELTKILLSLISMLNIGMNDSGLNGLIRKKNL